MCILGEFGPGKIRKTGGKVFFDSSSSTYEIYEENCHSNKTWKWSMVHGKTQLSSQYYDYRINGKKNTLGVKLYDKKVKKLHFMMLDADEIFITGYL